MARLQWQIYIARVGFVENDTTKLRPVLVLNEPVGSHKIVLIAPIFSLKTDHNLPGDIQIPDNYVDLGLVKPSTIRLHRMITLPASDFQEQLGKVGPELLSSVQIELKKLFGFD